MSAPGALPLSDKPSRGGELIGVSMFLTVWGTLFLAARIYTRVFQTRSFGWDDGFLIGAWVAGWVGEALTFKQVQYGQGQPFNNTLSKTPQHIAENLKYQNFAIFVNGVSMCLLKVGIGIGMLRLRLGKPFQIAVWVAIFISCLVNLTVFAGCFAKCSPIARIWDQSVPGTCWPKWGDLITSYSQTAGNIVTDLLFSLGPLYFLAKVKVSKYNKWALRGVFVIGLLAAACAIAKCNELPKLGKSTTDFTYDTVTLEIWVYAEFNAGLFAASLPPLKSTFEHLLVRFFNVRSGLTTPSATNTFKSNGYAVHSYGPSGHSKTHSSGGAPTYGGFNFSRKRGSNAATAGNGPAYVMRDVSTIKSNRRRDPDEISSESEDQKHILQAASGSVQTGTGSEDETRDGWITKTVEYTVKEDEEDRRHRHDQDQIG